MPLYNRALIKVYIIRLIIIKNHLSSIFIRENSILLIINTIRIKKQLIATDTGILLILLKYILFITNTIEINTNVILVNLFLIKSSPPSKYKF